MFWLASGHLGTYDTIIHGRAVGSDAEDLVHECLSDEEWWRDLRAYRGSSNLASARDANPISIADVLESSTGQGRRKSSAASMDARRLSVSPLADLPKKPTVSTLSRLGVNMGIHTHSLPTQVFEDSDTEVESDTDETSDSEGSNLNGDFNDAASLGSTDDLEIREPVRRPLLGTSLRRRSHGTLILRTKSSNAPTRVQHPTYGTMATAQAANSRSDSAEDPFISTQTTSVEPEPTPARNPRGTEIRMSSAESAERPASVPPRLERPALSRQGSSMRFSSAVVPETKITTEADTGPKITFADAETGGTSRPERPGFSRNSSYGRFSSRVVPETKVNDGEAGPTVSFAEPESAPRSPVRTPARSRKNSASRRGEGGDMHLNIPDLLSSYQFSPAEDNESGSGSSYSTQGLPLSFNDLPNRAQHLIINELMRQNSTETSVLFTTLPIPEEGTCESEAQSLSYLSDIEVLCNELPPILMVLSNNMTVTVSL